MAISKNSLKTYLISKLKLINVFFILFILNPIDIESKAHLRGSYVNESEANEKAKERGCSGTFKLKEMWMPCQSEKELHKYLRKNK